MHEVPLHILIATADRSELLARTLSSLAACAIPPSLVSTLVVENGPPSGAEQMMRQADWLVDMGPGAGEHGGEVVAEGTAAQVTRNRRSVTGDFLSGRRRIDVPVRRTEDRGAFRVLGAREDVALHGRLHPARVEVARCGQA